MQSDIYISPLPLKCWLMCQDFYFPLYHHALSLTMYPTPPEIMHCETVLIQSIMHLSNPSLLSPTMFFPSCNNLADYFNPPPPFHYVPCIYRDYSHSLPHYVCLVMSTFCLYSRQCSLLEIFQSLVKTQQKQTLTHIQTSLTHRKRRGRAHSVLTNGRQRAETESKPHINTTSLQALPLH